MDFLTEMAYTAPSLWEMSKFYDQSMCGHYFCEESFWLALFVGQFSRDNFLPFIGMAHCNSHNITSGVVEKQLMRWSGYWIERNSWYYQRETKIKNSLYWSCWELPSLATTNVQWFCVSLFSLVTTPKMKRNSTNHHIADFNIHQHHLPIIGMCSIRFCRTILSKDV